VGRGNGVGRGRGVTLGVAVGGGVGVTEGITVGVAVAVGVAVGVTVGVGVGVGPAAQNISIVASGVTPSTSYPPANQMWSVPLVSVGKLRRGLLNGIPSDQVSVPGS
jgi:hypothetical protein